MDKIWLVAIGGFSVLVIVSPLFTTITQAEVAANVDGFRNTSISQLSNAKPSDCAASQSRVERYGCIAAHPDKSFQGNHTLTCYEFAADLNFCLDRVQELIAFATADCVH